MPLFGRKKAPKVTMSYAPGGPSVPLVSTPVGMTPLQQIVDWGWVSIAAHARWGYQQQGRGVVSFESESGSMTYVAAERFAPHPIRPEVFAACAGYDPDLQVVLVTEIIHARGFKRAPEKFVATLTAPVGGLAPEDLAPERYDFIERKES